MKKKTIRKIRNVLIQTIICLVILSGIDYLVQVHTIPDRNRAYTEQLNGGDEEFVAMQDTKKIMQVTDDLVGLLFVFILGFGIGRIARIIQNERRKEKKNIDN